MQICFHVFRFVLSCEEYPLGNDHILVSHQTRKGKSSTQKYVPLGGDMLVTRRVYECI